MLLTAKTIKNTIDAVLSPKFASFDVLWRGDYHWVEPGDMDFRRIIWFQQLKGSVAVVGFGLSLNFVPQPSSSRIVYHRTARSARPDVFEWPESYRNSFSHQSIFESIDCRPDRFEQSLDYYSSRLAPELAGWFERTRSLERIQEELERQVRASEPTYRLHHPSPIFVLAFVKARCGETENAVALLRRAFANTDDPDRFSMFRQHLRTG